MTIAESLKRFVGKVVKYKCIGDHLPLEGKIAEVHSDHIVISEKSGEVLIPIRTIFWVKLPKST